VRLQHYTSRAVNGGDRLRHERSVAPLSLAVLSESVRFASKPSFQDRSGGEVTMKRIVVLAVMVGLAALGARAQTVTGSGTSGNLAKFTGSSTIANSVIVESNGNIGIGDPGPLSPLTVINFSNSLTTG